MTIAAFAVGCKEDEPTRTELVTQTWQISKVYDGEDDVTATYLIGLDDYQLLFESDGDFTESFYPLGGGAQTIILGTWSFSNGEDRLILIDGGNSRVYDIVRLDEEHLNVIERESGDDLEINLIPAP